MTRYSNTLDGGTSGTGVTPANSGGASGDAFTTVSASGSATVAYDSSVSMHGGMSAKFTPASNGLAAMYWTTTGSKHVALRMYMRVTTHQLLGRTLFAGVGGTRVASLTMLGSGKVRVEDASGSSGIWDSTAMLPLSDWARLELDLTVGTSTTNGVINFAMYSGDSSTPLDSFSSTTANLGTAALTRGLAGNWSSVTASPFWIDDFAWDDAATGFIGVPGADPEVESNWHRFTSEGWLPLADPIIL